jgi:hypothetical protein
MSNGDIFDLRASQNYSQGAIRFRDVQRGHIQFEALFARSDPITRCPTRTRSIEDQPEPYAFASQRAIGESRNSPTNGKRKAREQGQDSLLDIWSHAGRESRAEQFVISHGSTLFLQGIFFRKDGFFYVLGFLTRLPHGLDDSRRQFPEGLEVITSSCGHEPSKGGIVVTPRYKDRASGISVHRGLRAPSPQDPIREYYADNSCI